MAECVPIAIATSVIPAVIAMGIVVLIAMIVVAAPVPVTGSGRNDDASSKRRRRNYCNSDPSQGLHLAFLSGHMDEP